jgi:hypothetical protein
VFVHAGNPVLREISECLTRVLFGTAEHPPVGTLEDTTEGPVLRWTGPDGRAHGPVAMHLSGDHNLENVLAAIAVGLHFGVTAEQCTLAVSGYLPRNNRSEWRQTPRNSVLLDAYNANPSSMEHAIAHFAGLPQLEKAPGFVVLGDMAELGEYSPQEHARIAALLEQTGLEGMCVGPEFAAVVSGKGSVKSCLTPEEARDRGCRTIEGAPITIVQSPRPRPAASGAAAPAAPGAASGRPGDPTVDPAAQRQRDTDARRILEAELRREEERLAGLKRDYNNGEPERRGDERNFQNYLDRVAQMKAGITRSESDVAALKRELGKLPP